MTKPHAGYRHEGFIYHGIDEFLAATVPFIREGVTSGQPVMVAVAGARLDRLRAEVGADTRGVQFVDMAECGRNPSRIIPAWLEFIEEQAPSGRPVRGIGEPIWAGRRPAEVVECQLHEILLNLAVDPDTPLWLRCPYDADALEPSILQEAHHSHPILVDADGGYRGSTCYGGAHHAGVMFSAELPAPPSDACEIGFTAATIGIVSDEARRHAIAAGLPVNRAEDLVAAAHEIATNSVRHGGGAGSMRIWQQDDALICEIHDGGRIEDLLVGRMPSPAATVHGRGLWAANEVSDLLQIRSSANGTRVRVVDWLTTDVPLPAGADDGRSSTVVG